MGERTLGVRLEIVKHSWTGNRGTWAPQGVKVDWDKIIPKGLHVLPRRWVVERTNAWITRHRRLSHDFETSCAAGAPLCMTTANWGQKILLANSKKRDGQDAQRARLVFVHKELPRYS